MWTSRVGRVARLNACLAKVTRRRCTCSASAEEAYDLHRLSGPRLTDTVGQLKDLRIQEFKGSRYVVPSTVACNLNGNGRTWDMIQSMGSVAIVLYHTELDAAIVVRQFRPPVWASQIGEDGRKPEVEAGFTYELCAGLIDKEGLSPKEIAREEILEEVGYDVELESITGITSYVHACAHLGTEEQIFYAEVDESMRASSGGGLSDDGEAIEVFALPMGQALSFVLESEVPKSAALIIGLQWLLNAKRDGGK